MQLSLRLRGTGRVFMRPSMISMRERMPIIFGSISVNLVVPLLVRVVCELSEDSVQLILEHAELLLLLPFVLLDPMLDELVADVLNDTVGLIAAEI